MRRSAPARLGPATAFVALLVSGPSARQPDHPSVEAPMGDFFGVAMGIDAPINSYPIRVSGIGRARNCFRYMPFNKAARVTVTKLRGPKGRDMTDAGRL